MSSPLFSLFANYMENPGLETFLALRSAWLSLPDVDPYCPDLAGVPQMMMSDQYREASELIRRNMNPHYLLSPGTDLHLSMCMEKTGNQKDAEVELHIARAMLDGIKMTGGGSERRPFLVTRVSDEYDLLLLGHHEATGQTLLKSNSRMLDCFTLKEGGPLYFDVTEIHAIMDRAFKNRTAG